MTVKAEAQSPLNLTLPVNPRPFNVILALASIYIIWGSTYLAMRYGLESFPPFLMSSIRFTITGALLYLFLRRRGVPAPTRLQWRSTMITGLLLLCIGNGAVAFAEQWVASGLAALAVAAVPIWASLFAGLMGRWPNRLEWAGLGVGLAGVALLNLENGMQANPLGAVVLIIGPMGWALGSMLSRRLELPANGLMLNAAQLICGGTAMLVISVLLGERMNSVPTLSSILAVAYLAVFGSLIAFTAYIYLLRNVRPALATSYAYVNPMLAVLLGVLLAGEEITPVGIVAMFVIIGGVGLIMIAKEQRAPAES